MAQRFNYVEQCPACHDRIPPGSSRCPRCQTTFCVRCGKPVHTDRHEGFFCETVHCPYHNRLLCRGCLVVVEVQQGMRFFRWMKRSKETCHLGCPGCGKPARSAEDKVRG